MQVSRALVFGSTSLTVKVRPVTLLMSRASDIGWECACVGRAVPPDYGEDGVAES